MNQKLFLQAIIKFVFGVLLVGLLVFLPAGTLRFFNGWLFMGIVHSDVCCRNCDDGKESEIVRIAFECKGETNGPKSCGKA